MAELYVRPPLVPREPTPRAVAVWRFRVVAALLLALLGLTVLLLLLHFTGAAAEDPGFGVGLGRHDLLDGLGQPLP